MPEDKSWWSTLPGILTALAGLITAITALVVVFHPKPSASPSVSTTTTQQTPSRSDGAPHINNTSSKPTTEQHSSAPLDQAVNPIGVQPPISPGQASVVLPPKPREVSPALDGISSIKVEVNQADFYSAVLVTYDYSGAPSSEADGIRVCALQDELKYCSKAKQLSQGHGSLRFIVGLEDTGGIIGPGTQASLAKGILFRACYIRSNFDDFDCKQVLWNNNQ